MRLSWKIYIWLFAIFTVSIYLRNLHVIRGVGIISGCFGLFGLLPLFLFAYKEKWLPVNFWKIFFVLKIILDAIQLYLSLNKTLPHILLLTSRPPAFLGFLISLLIMLSFLVPAYIAFYLYAFRQDKIFDTAK